MPRIMELYAWVVEDTGPDDEGVPAFFWPSNNAFMPMMGADMEMADMLREQAQLAADVSGKPITLRRSIALEDVETLLPRGGS